MRSVTFLTSQGVDIDKSLELFGDINTYNSNVGEFLISSKDKLNKLTLYKDQKDMSNYAIYVHSLKSDARYFGFKSLQDIAYEHEKKSKEGDIFYVYNNFQQLSDEVAKYSKVIEEYLNGSDDENNEEEISTQKESSINIQPIPIYDNKTILVVDDSNIVRNFVKRIFTNEYNVGTAKDGIDAINIIEANSASKNLIAILLDLNMPKADGFVVLDYMEKNNLLEKIPVSIISGDSSKETISKAFEYQIVDMLGKPFNDADIKRVVEKTVYFKGLD